MADFDESRRQAQEFLSVELPRNPLKRRQVIRQVGREILAADPDLGDRLPRSHHDLRMLAIRFSSHVSMHDAEQRIAEMQQRAGGAEQFLDYLRTRVPDHSQQPTLFDIEGDN